MTRAVVTGAGVVSPIGSDLAEFRTNLAQGTRGIGTISHFPTEGFPYALAAEARADGLVIELSEGADRKAAFFARALDELFADGRLLRDHPPASRALSVGTGIDHFDFIGYAGRGEPAGEPWRRYRRDSRSVVERAAADHSVAGPCAVNVAACVASTQALGQALRMIRSGFDGLVVSGGFDSMLSPLHFLGFYRLGALADWPGEPSEACRPFDRRRCGVVLGEGAAVFAIESGDKAPADAVLAEIAGYASTMDAYMVTDPEPSGRALAAAALGAIADAGIAPGRIDCVHLHGTGTPKNDAAEARAMALIFGARSREVPVFSLKGQVGHLVGACGAVELLAVLDSVANQRVLPTVNFAEPDPEVPLRVVRDAPLALRVDHALKLNSGFGGQNSALVVRRHGA